MRTSCEACTGDTRLACEAVYSNFRNDLESSATDAYRTVGNDNVVGQIEFYDSVQAQAETLAVELGAIGCRQNPVNMAEAIQSEVSVTLSLAASTVEEEFQKTEAERAQRVEKLLEESEDIFARSRQRVSDALTGLEAMDARHKETDEIVDRLLGVGLDSPEGRITTLIGLGAEVSRSAADLAETALAEAKAAEDTAAKKYCKEQGWDIDSLDFVQNMDLRAHLREEGFKP